MQPGKSEVRAGSLLLGGGLAVICSRFEKRGTRPMGVLLLIVERGQCTFHRRATAAPMWAL
jgi:hypothetical protein